MMMFKFNTYEEASDAVEIINQAEGLPINYLGIPLYSVTKNYCDIIEYNSKFYIIKDNITEAVSDNWEEENLIIPYEGVE